MNKLLVYQAVMPLVMALLYWAVLAGGGDPYAALTISSLAGIVAVFAFYDIFTLAVAVFFALVAVRIFNFGLPNYGGGEVVMTAIFYGFVVSAVLLAVLGAVHSVKKYKPIGPAWLFAICNICWVFVIGYVAYVTAHTGISFSLVVFAIAMITLIPLSLIYSENGRKRLQVAAEKAEKPCTSRPN